MNITAIARVSLIGSVILLGLLGGLRQDRPVEALPQLTDITQSTAIKFFHVSSPDKKYIVESMSGGVALIDYDRDGLLDIYFTNAPTVEMALAGQKVRSALYHNNGDGAFTDVTDKVGVGDAGWAMGACVAQRVCPMGLGPIARASMMLSRTAPLLTKLAATAAWKSRTLCVEAPCCIGIQPAYR